MDLHSSDRSHNHEGNPSLKQRKSRRRWAGWQDWLAKAGLGAAEGPSVSTDQPDYSPGERAVITAKGFKPGDEVTFAIADDPAAPGDDGDADVYQPFAVKDGSAADLDGQVNGQVVTTWRVPSDNNGTGAGVPDALNATLNLKAKGSGRAVAKTSFTDSTELADPPLAAPAPAVSLDQSEYEPGQTATITASGFAVGSAIEFAIADAPDQPGDDGEVDNYPPFAVTDGQDGDLDGVANGEVVTTWLMPADPNAALNLTAMGAEGESASTSASIAAASLATTTSSPAPTVSTDKPDYAPNETATINSSGFIPGSTVEFQVEIVSDPGADAVFGTSDDVVDTQATQLLAETPWLVTDGSEEDLDPADGSVQTTWLVDPDALNTTLRLTATGFGADGVKATLDDEVARTAFTDAVGSFSKPYAHWSDEPLPGDWNNNILNDNKSNYFEGEVIPHVYMYGASNNAQLVNGETYSFNVTYNWYQQNTDAGGFAYMTQYNPSRQPTVFNWATPAVTPAEDGLFTNNGGMKSGSFYTVDANITNVSGVTYAGTGTKDGVVTITFEYTGATTSNGYAAIYYGLYVAKPGEVPSQGAGKTNGANAWSGGSLQTTVDIGGSGATSIQLAPSAVIPGEISGLKFNDSNGNGTQDTGELGLAGWTIKLDSDSNTGNGSLGSVVTANGTTDDLDGDSVIDPVGFYYFSVTPDADKSDPDNDGYYVYEVNQNGWTPTAPSAGFYGPLVVSTATPAYLNQVFANRQSGQADNPAIDVKKSVTSITGGTADKAGDDILYAITIANTGNVSLTGVTVTDKVESYSVTSATYVSGDAGTIGVLEVGETWTYSASYKLTQADLENNGGGDGKLDNLATGDTAQTTEDTATASVNLVRNASLNIVKAASIPGGTADQKGEVITYTISVQNTGNQTLTDVTVTDDFVSDLTRVADVVGDNDVLLEVGETWGYSATHTVTQDEIDSGAAILNTATATSKESAPDTADASVDVEQTDFAQIAPTGTTCDQYIQGKAQDFSDYYASQLGNIQYGTRNGRINSTNPGVFFYYTGLSGAIKGAAPITVKIDQENTGPNVVNGISNPGNTEWNLKTIKNDVKVYRVIDVNGNGKIDTDGSESCQQVNSGIVVESLGGDYKGDLNVNFTPLAGSLYVIGVKYDTSTVVGLPQGGLPKVNYTFSTNVGADDTIEETDAKGIALAPKTKALTFDGAAMVGGAALTKAQLAPVVGAAIDYWAAEGVKGAKLNKLRRSDVLIGDLGGISLGSTDGITVYVDDDAAGHGWSVSRDGVKAGRVDLFSAVVHEFGHMLGYEHDDMGSTLGIGERHLPFEAGDDYKSQFQMAAGCRSLF